MRQHVRAFARERIVPGAAVVDADPRFPVEMLAKMGELGRRGVTTPERYGGSGIAAQSVGIARAAFEAARDYADERQAFLRRIREFQGVALPVADMASRTEAAGFVTDAALQVLGGAGYTRHPDLRRHQRNPEGGDGRPDLS